MIRGLCVDLDSEGRGIPNKDLIKIPVPLFRRGLCLFGWFEVLEKLEECLSLRQQLASCKNCQNYQRVRGQKSLPRIFA